MIVATDPAIAALDLLILDAETKYHAALTGGGVVKVSVDGMETEFSKVSASDLAAYIARLQARRDGLVTGAASSGAIGIVF